MPDSGEHRRFPKRLHHHTPVWATAGACFHIRLRLAPDCPVQLTDLQIGPAVLHAARFYHLSLRWACHLILLMPDHAHALLEFPAGVDMSQVLSDWKRFITRNQGVIWQTNYFDHRIRNHHLLQKTAAYIRRNPVAKGLCAHESDWPWVWPQIARD